MKAVFSNLMSGISRQRLSGVTALFLATFFGTFLSGVHPALASVTMGEVFCNVADNLYPFIDVFNMVAYCASVVFIMQGLMHLRNHHEEPRQHPHHKTFALLGAGAMLSALPSVVDMLFETIFSGSYGSYSGGDSGGLGYCVGSMNGTSTAAGGAVGLDTMLANFVNNIQYPLEMLVSVVAITLGVFLIIRGLMKAAKYGNDPKTHSITQILANLIIGAALVAISDNIGTIMSSVMGNDGSIKTFDSLSWSALGTLGDTTHFKVALKAALTFFQLVGLISFVRGWNVIRNAVEGVGQATFAQGMTHIIGGVLAMNIYMFMQMVDATMGTQFVS